MPTARATALARPIEPGAAWHARDADVAARFHPLYRGALARFAGGELVARGLPFRLPPSGAARWALVDRPLEIDAGGRAATHLVLLAFCDAWRDDADERPTGVPLGWVIPVGEQLAAVDVELGDGTVLTSMLRRRFEVNEGIIGWGSGAFLAVTHRAEEPVDWRGPHPRQAPGRYAPAGHAGPLTVLPGGWGARQTGVEDHVPSADDDLMLWLHAVDVAADGEPRPIRSVRLAPLPGDGRGRDVVLAALTTFAGSASPVRWRPRRSLRLDAAVAAEVDVDLGLIARRRPMPDGSEEIELTAADDAALYVDGSRIPLGALPATSRQARIEALAPVDRRTSVELIDTDGRRVAARVHVRARDGRVLAPLGHRDEVNPGLYEDVGADLRVGDVTYAYVDGAFEIDLPADGATLEIVAGMGRAPLVVDVDRPGDPLRLALAVEVRPTGEGWTSGDTHVHFLAPTTALLQARAEGVNVVHLLATQWGDLHTGRSDVGASALDASGEHVVWVGSENRQNMLGHVGLVGTSHPILPFASGGPPEGRIGQPVTHLMADWLVAARDAGGLAVGAHFPLPMTEVPVDIALGLLDALEFQVLDPDLAGLPVREWYRYLDAGFRLPIVGGTDKMSAEVPLGQVRTWARLEGDGGPTFDRWAAAIRAGRTFVTSGPVLELAVDGHAPGDVLDLPPDATVEAALTVRAPAPIVGAVELVLDGRVVAANVVPEPVTELSVRAHLTIARTGWLAGRSRSPGEIASAFRTSLAAHSSPVYLEVRDRPRPPVDLGVPLALIEGMRAWLDALAPVRDGADSARFREVLAEAEARLRLRG